MKPKNLIFILCDELRTDALSIYGAPFPGICTPNIDSIGQRGTVFENCFCNSPVCVPSRTSMWTGLYPVDTGITGNEGFWPPYTLDSSIRSLPMVLEDRGYTSVGFGKNHVPPVIPMFRPEMEKEDGSDIFWGEKIRDSVGCIQPKGAPTMIGGLYEEQPGKYPPRRVTENAMSWLKSADRNKPFFMRISYLQPHTPVIPPAEYYHMYDSIPFTADAPVYEGVSRYEQIFRRVVDISNLSDEDIIFTKRAYYALVKWVDDQVGDILSCLKDTGLDSDTVIMFGADHGAALAENRCYSKQTYAPWVHRVPLLVYDPHSPRGNRVVSCCENVDIPRTVMSLLELQPYAQFKGRDLFDSEEGYVYSVIGYGEKDSIAFPYVKVGKWDENTGWPMRGCVRHGPYRFDMNVKLNGNCRLSEEDRDEFFTDGSVYPKENVNLINDPSYAHIVSDMRRRLKEHLTPVTDK